MNWLTEVFIVLFLIVAMICMPLYIVATLKPQQHIVAVATINGGVPNGQKRKTPDGRKYKIQCTGL